MKPSQLTKRIEELSEKLKPVPSEGIRFDFKSFTEPEQLVILKNVELYEKYHNHWTREAVLENKDVIVKCNGIVIDRATELYLFAMPRAMMLDEVKQWFFKFHFNMFLKNWIACLQNVKKWPAKDRDDFLRDITVKPKHKRNKKNGKENND
jgi:hypothetical protein